MHARHPHSRAHAPCACTRRIRIRDAGCKNTRGGRAKRSTLRASRPALRVGVTLTAQSTCRFATPRLQLRACPRTRARTSHPCSRNALQTHFDALMVAAEAPSLPLRLCPLYSNYVIEPGFVGHVVASSAFIAMSITDLAKAPISRDESFTRQRPAALLRAPTRYTHPPRRRSLPRNHASQLRGIAKRVRARSHTHARLGRC